MGSVDMYPESGQVLVHVLAVGETYLCNVVVPFVDMPSESGSMLVSGLPVGENYLCTGAIAFVDAPSEHDSILVQGVVVCVDAQFHCKLTIIHTMG